MIYLKSIVLFVSFNVACSIIAVNHWVLNDNGLITAKIDSPFYMREPQNLATFLDQIKHHEIVESTHLELLRQKDLMVEKIIYSVQFGMETIEQAKCSAKFDDPDNLLSHTRLTRNYLNRFNKNAKYELLVKPELPYCERFLEFNVGMCCFDHLPSLENSRLLEISPEDDMKDEELEIDNDYFLSDIVAGLKKNPNSWKHHALASYFWRMKGDAHQAVECARRAILLAPREFKDVPLLSLGTILSRAEQFNDADIVLSAAVDHAPHVAENHLALGITLAMVYNFNRSIEHLEAAERVDSSYSQKIRNLKNFVMCLNKLNRNSEKIDGFIEYFKKEVNGLRLLKSKISASHEKLIQQQVPLGARYLDMDKTKGPFTHRGQYCSTRTLAGNDEPVLFCDFYSEIQMRLESYDVDIEALEREVNANSEAIKERLTMELHSQLNSQRLKTKPSRD